jgi:hypothetical protein
MRFHYVIDKIRHAPFKETPFRHVRIDNLFSSDDFLAIITAQEISLEPSTSDCGLFDAMFEAGYKIIDFPGCITDREAYLRWRKDRSSGRKHIHSACESFGMVLRLVKPHSQIITDLMQFLNSSPFQQAIGDRYGMDVSGHIYDAGIQKYLDGYEISPHPDIRKKALTFMVNINPAPGSETTEHHTHFLRFREKYEYVRKFWQANPEHDRCWVPWDWCKTVDRHTANNSMVIFAPSDDTLHAVKADYDHLTHQRSQLYGNFWHPEPQATSCPEWEDLVITARNPKGSGIKALVPQPVRDAVDAMRRRSDAMVEKRFYQR